MSYQVITDFRQGLDARKYKLALPPGTLLTCDNAHVTQGGEIEKRKAFVPVTIPAAYTGNHFGLQPGDAGIYVFGSTIVSPSTSTRDRNANVSRLKLPNAAGFFAVNDVVNISGVGGVGYNGTGIVITDVTDSSGDQYISYASVNPNETLNTADTGGTVIKQSAVLPSPLVYELVVYPGAVGGTLGWQNWENLTAVVSSTTFGGAPFVLAKFADGIFPFYGAGETYVWNGSGLTTSTVGNAARLVEDSVAGLQLNSTAYPTDGSGLRVNLTNLINASDSYTATGGSPDIQSIPSTLNGTPYTVDITLDTAAGTLTVAQQNSGTASVAATQAVGNFQIISAGDGSQATGTITNTSDGNMTDGDTVTIDSIVYRFKNAPVQAYDVKIGGTRILTMASFAAAINGSGVSGTDYFAGTAKHPTVLCVALNTTTAHFTMSLMAINGGSAGNAIVTTSTASTRLVMSGATLAGAVDSKVNQIVVNGATNLLTASVSFTTDIPTTAAAVATAINSNAASGYQATSDGATVTIVATATGTAANGYSIQVQAQGALICGTGAFSLTGSGFTLDYCRANGVDLITASILLVNETVMTYPQVASQVLSDFCRAIANNINAGTATHGYLAHCPAGGVSIYLCKATTTSTDKQQVLDVSVTAAGGTGSVVPGSLTPLSVTLSATAVVIPFESKSTSVTATVAGGLGPYNYKWQPQTTLSLPVVANNPKSAQTTFSYVGRQAGRGTTLTTPTQNQAPFVLVVTDALGEQAISVPVYVTVLAIRS
jgi:hypothetical protein